MCVCAALLLRQRAHAVRERRNVAEKTKNKFSVCTAVSWPTLLTQVGLALSHTAVPLAWNIAIEDVSPYTLNLSSYHLSDPARSNPAVAESARLAGCMMQIRA